ARGIKGSSCESGRLLHLQTDIESRVSSTTSIPAKAFTPRKDRFAMNLLQMPEGEAYSIIGGVWYPWPNYSDSRPPHWGLDRSLRRRRTRSALPALIRDSPRFNRLAKDCTRKDT